MSDEQALITVAVCSYNRHTELKKVVNKLLSQQALSSALYKVLVVDNSDDERARQAFARRFSGRPNLTIIESSPPGLSRARNVALESCTTRYLAYLDDDASPKPEWLSAILRAFTTHDPAIVAGPIHPIWPGPQPDWLPGKYVGCLTILDHGPTDRWLVGQELAYGANMAFKADALREVGGFNVSLGRRGGPSLLSEEELEPQLALRLRGGRAFYAASAGVFHTVHANRLSRNYFRARMTWQAVSAILRDPPLRHFDWSQQEIRTAAEKLGVGELIAKLLTYKDSETFSFQLDILYHLFAILLESKDLDDLTVESILSAPADNANRAAPVWSGGPVGPSSKPNKPSAPVRASTKHLIVEGQPSHFFLYTLYAELLHSQLLVFPHPIWHNFDDPLAYLQRSITPSLRTMTFVTLDPLIYGSSRRAFNELLRSSGLANFGILHRLPESVEQADALCEAARRMTRIMVLAESLVAPLQQQFQIDNVAYLPIHPPFAKYLERDRTSIRTKIGASKDHVVFGLLGESRRGKGMDLLLDAIDYVRPEDLEQMFFLVAGRSQHIDRQMIANAFASKDVKRHIDLRSSDNPLKYAVLSEREFGEYVNASDVGVVLYQHEQRRCMSGVAPNYVWGFKPLLAFRDSVIGHTAVDNDLGVVIDEETPQGVAEGLTNALQMVRRGGQPSQAHRRYREAIAPPAVLKKLSDIVGEKRVPTAHDRTISAKATDRSRDHAEGLSTRFEQYVSNLPLLHSWDGGVTWNTGGFQREQLDRLFRFLNETLPPSPMLLETGAGNSTICLLFLNPARLVSIAPEAALFDRIRTYCRKQAIPVDALDARVSGSEWVLAQLAWENRDHPPCFDFALIDGCHNWPMVFVDFCYANHMLKCGGLLMVDDVNLHSVKELARMLSEHPDFRLELDLGKSLIFRRLSEARAMAEWTDVPYIWRMTNLYAQAPNPFSLKMDVALDKASASA